MTTNDTPDPAEAGPDQTDLGRTLVLNGLRDLTEDTEHVLGDDHSRTLLREAYESVTTEAQRTSFEDALSTAHAGREDGSETESIRQVVDAVVGSLLDQGVETRLDHQTRVRLPAREVAVYNLAKTGNVSTLEILEVDPGVKEAIREGAEALVAGSYEEAITAFERAIDEAGTSDGGIVARTLAGLAAHRDGRDERAQDYVEETLHLDTGAWSAAMVGMAAAAETPALFRDGAQRVSAYFRARIDPPDAPGVTASVKLGQDRDAIEEAVWVELDGSPRYYELEELDRRVAIRLELAGQLDALPVIHAYYLTLGVIDVANGVARSAEHLFLTGPETAPSSEVVFFEAG